LKRAVIIGLVGLLLCIAAAYFVFKGRRYDVIITQAQIDTALKQRFPVTKRYLILFELTYSNPEVTLLTDAQRVRVGLNVELNVRIGSQTKNLSGGATLTGSVNYHQETQEFYLTDVQFDRLNVGGIPPEHLQTVQGFASKAADEYVRRFPIYRLTASNTKMTAAKLLLKDVRIHDQQIVATMGY